MIVKAKIIAQGRFHKKGNYSNQCFCTETDEQK